MQQCGWGSGAVGSEMAKVLPAQFPSKRRTLDWRIPEGKLDQMKRKRLLDTEIQ